MKVLVTLTLALAISYVQADGPHIHEHAPAPVHDTGYGAPDTGYGAPEHPDTGYGAPVHDTYGAPDTGYGAPVHDHYEPTPYEHHEVYHEENIDITPFIVAILVIVGLSLLFPTHVHVPNVGRKRRDAEDIESSDFIGRSLQIYDHLNMALEPIDRGCLEKITCEAGGLAYDAGLTSSPLLQLVVPFVPGKYGKFMKHFVYAENCHKIKCSAYP